MDFDTFIDTLSKIKHIPLPGLEAQVKMSPAYRLQLMEEQQKRFKTARKAGVMALFYPNARGEVHLMLILRKTYHGVHSAQVGFPGGKLEPGDASMEAAARRETEEEIGVAREDIEVLCGLTPLYIPPSNFMVYPFIGWVRETPVFTKEDQEVEALIAVPLDEFLDEDNRGLQNMMTSLDLEVEVPVYRLQGHVVWGATAMMLSEVKDLLKKVL